MDQTGKYGQQVLIGRLIKTVPNYMAPPAATVPLQTPL